MIFFEIAIIIFLFAVYFFIHTLFASNNIKLLIAKNYPDFLPFYRLTYNIYAMLSLVGIIILSPKPDVIIYDLSYPFDLIIVALQFLSLIAILWTLKYFNIKEFLGISQIIRFYKGNYNANDLDEFSELKTDGIFKLCRHPLYLFFILFIGLRPVMSLFYFIAFLCTTLYFYIGSFYEENKLVDKFGDAYLKYQSNTPRIIPLKIFR